MRGAQLVSSLEKLLRSLPRRRGGGGGGNGKEGQGKKPRPKPRQLNPDKEQMQPQPKDDKKSKECKDGSGRKPEDKLGAGADARRRVEAWLARLPPEEQERIRRGDMSGVPLRYRAVIERITVERAVREGKESGE